MTQRPLPRGIAALEGRALRLPRAGMVRLGEKGVSKNGNEYPREIDYFNLVDAPAVVMFYANKKIAELTKRLQDSGLEAAKREIFSKQLGILSALLAKVPEGTLPDEPTSKALSEALKCRELDVLFPTDDLASIIDICYLMYGTTGWKCRGDGQIAWNREREDETPCAGEDCQMVRDNKCKRQMRLTFVCYLVPGLCVYQSVTSSWRSIENTLAYGNVLQEQFGRIDMIPLKMYREPYTTTYTDENGKQHQQVHHCIRLDFAESLLNVRRLQLAGGRDLELPEPTDECADDMYPRSLQTAEAAALPPAQEAVVIETPAIAAVPDPEPDPEPEPAAVDGNAEVQSIIEGFKICGIPEVEWPQFFANYAGRLDELEKYLSSLLDSQLPPIPETPKPAPKRQRKTAEPATKTPAPAPPAAKSRTQGKALF